MPEEKKVVCPWCADKRSFVEKRDKSDYAEIILRNCVECGQVISAYLAEDQTVLEKVRTFKTA